MDTILMKYQNRENEYLVYDTHKYTASINARAVRTICSRNCGLGSTAIVAGPFISSDGSLEMKMFAPDGEEKPIDQEAKSAGFSYLWDAGYLGQQSEKETTAKAIGKIFLSEEFVTSCFCVA